MALLSAAPVADRSLRRRALAACWEIYPPVALLIAAILMAGGCSMKVGEMGLGQMAEAEPADVAPAGEAQLASAEVDAPPALYPADLPVVGNAAARAVALHGKDRVDLINLSDLAWPAGGRVWLNGQYAFTLPAADPGVFLKLKFDGFSDADGKPFPKDNRKTLVERVELEFAGELANVRYDLSY